MSYPAATFRALIADLDARAANAAQRNKPTMWAYYLDMVEGLEGWFAGIDGDGGFAGAALALSQKAEAECGSLPHRDAARLWALGVYARRVLSAWGVGTGPRVSLAWLRDREKARCVDEGGG